MKNLQLMTEDSFRYCARSLIDFEKSLGLVCLETPDAIWFTFEEVWYRVLSDTEFLSRDFTRFVDSWIDDLKAPIPALIYGHALYFRQQDIQACLDSYRNKTQQKPVN